MPRTLLCLSCNIRFDAGTADTYHLNCPHCATPLVPAPPWSTAPLAVDVPLPPPPTGPLGKVNCRHCGKEMPGECVFCPFCEEPLAPPPQPPVQPWPRRRPLRIVLASLGAIALGFWGAMASGSAIFDGDLAPATVLGVVMSILFVVALIGYSTRERWRDLGVLEIILRMLIGVGFVAAFGCGCTAALGIFALVICAGRRW